MPFVTSNVVLSCLVRMADILAQLVQKADSLSALQLTGALFTINWGTLCQTHLPQNLHDPIRRTFLALGGEGGGCVHPWPTG